MTAHDMLACRNSRGATLVAPPEYRVQLKPESAARWDVDCSLPIVPVSADMVNVLTNNTATRAEAERVLEAVWPEPAAQKVKRLAVGLLAKQLEIEAAERAAHERLAIATLGLGLAVVRQEIEPGLPSDRAGTGSGAARPAPPGS